ncbi:MAG TPA: hypothetical protein VMT85_24050 [Thermoanaerobaculia bacterium]|nr:hypothetical protein [Thermoanaerobaculia bacterium]
MNRLPHELEQMDGACGGGRGRRPLGPARRRLLLAARFIRRALPLLAVLASCGLLASPLGASEARNFRVFATGGLGGPLDAEAPDPGVGNSSFQLGFSWVTQPQARVGIRLGSVDLGDAVEQLVDPSLDWVTIGGEYLYSETYFESGLYLGLGYYRLDGALDGVSQDDSAVGVVLGATGDFPINQRFSIIGELSVHWADLDQAGQLFGFAHVGVAFSF